MFRVPTESFFMSFESATRISGSPALLEDLTTANLISGPTDKLSKQTTS